MRIAISLLGVTAAIALVGCPAQGFVTVFNDSSGVVVVTFDGPDVELQSFTPQATETVAIFPGDEGTVVAADGIAILDAIPLGSSSVDIGGLGQFVSSFFDSVEIGPSETYELTVTADSAGISVYNEPTNGDNIVAVYVVDPSSPDWGQNLLPGDLVPGDTFILPVAPGQFDVRVESTGLFWDLYNDPQFSGQSFNVDQGIDFSRDGSNISWDYALNGVGPAGGGGGASAEASSGTGARPAP